MFLLFSADLLTPVWYQAINGSNGDNSQMHKCIHYALMTSWSMLLLKYRKISNVRRTKLILVSSRSCLCPIHWSQVLCQEWRCGWSSADRRCSNYIWVINNLIAYWGVLYWRLDCKIIDKISWWITVTCKLLIQVVGFHCIWTWQGSLKFPHIKGLLLKAHLSVMMAHVITKAMLQNTFWLSL